MAIGQTGEPGAPTGVGVDALPHTRPGVPRERLDGAAAMEPPEQQRGVAVLSRQGLRAATPVFGTAQPARGLSGLVRRAAYRVPEHRAARWALLLAGDRLDVLEQRLARNLWVVPAAVGLAAGYAAMARALARR
jgi:hypothetical protein